MDTTTFVIATLGLAALAMALCCIAMVRLNNRLVRALIARSLSEFDAPRMQSSVSASADSPPSTDDLIAEIEALSAGE